MALPSLIRSVLSSRKRKPSSSNAVDSSTEPSSSAKRARNQSAETATQTTTPSHVDTTAVAIPPSSLPSLELSNTFESTTSSSTSPTSHSSEYYSAITAAKARLQTAQLIATQSQQNLSRAQIEFNRSSLEVQHAIDFYNGVEKRWGVIDVDSEVSSSVSKDNDDADSFPPPQSDDGRVVVATNGNENTANDDTTIISDNQGNCDENSIQQVQVNQAGESIVNGTYNLLVNSTTLINHYYHTMPNGPIYIHTEGPFSIQNEDFDVCIFQKRGYGDKIRWCIALVPASLNDEVTCTGLSNDDNDTNDEEEESRSRNFALAYIYYWMEVDANEAMNDASSLLLNGTNDEGGKKGRGGRSI